jgi:septal ring factor EnvC (AmiA/AmiB activator)
MQTVVRWRTAVDEQVEWLRDEYRGRESELSSVSELAKRAGVQPHTVTTWSRRHASFPDLVMIKRGAVTTKYYSTEEFDAYRRIQGDVARQARTKKSSGPRTPATIAQERLEDLDALDARLAEEEKEAAAKLAAILQRRHQLDEERGKLRRHMEQELAKIKNALGTEQP